MSTKQARKGMVAARAGALTFLAVCAVGMGAAIHAAGIHLRKIAIHPPDNRQLSAIPAETENWVRMGSDAIESAEVLEVLRTENYLTRSYRRRGTGEDGTNPMVLEFHAAYYTGMIDTVPHVPERCFVGGGLQQARASRVLDLNMPARSWMPDETAPAEFAGRLGRIYTVRLSNNPAHTDAPGRRVRLPREVGPDNPFRIRAAEYLLPNGRRYFAGYFFIANGGTVPNANDVRTLAFNLTDDYAYYLKVQVNSASVNSVEELVEEAASLLDELIGEIMRCVPDWIEVEMGNYPPAETG
ncbi:MAG: EpsI family protein [Phycisphaerales bacterium]|nr:exosortase-associated EpsI family protein [Planctomycetota bacterium]MCH8509468.1 EpsI family protein [Phycisphaerales bacterium]